MATKLERLLESIDPTRVFNEKAARVDQAMNSFRITSGRIDRWDEFTETMARFYCHVENKILRIDRACSLEMDWGRCSQLLEKEYGPGGFRAAFEIARTGNEGGLYGLLKAVAGGALDKYVGHEISAQVNHFWDGLSVDEKLSVMDEYLAKYGHLLPSELTEGGAFRIKANFTKVLEKHPLILQRLGRIGR